eukprot:TRINITY_DN23195_c0_g1_i1.p1 TRINITY_DN23195_c0_g1~~TRINITY_DN23195_c0_g1_i1.p1  ORF type:complete len:281 (+),score=79.50 TRINITY_DN23195_c0_g1_i1:42-845(+)
MAADAADAQRWWWGPALVTGAAGVAWCWRRRCEGGRRQPAATAADPPPSRVPEFLLVPPLPRHGVGWGAFQLLPATSDQPPQWESQEWRISLCGGDHRRWTVARWDLADEEPLELAAIAAHEATSPTDVLVWKCPFGVLPVSWPDRVCTAARDLTEAADWARRKGVGDFFEQYGDPPAYVVRALTAMPTTQSETHDCPVCHTTLEHLPARRLPCGHCFHKTCIDRWFRFGHTQCPLCRAAVPDLQPRRLLDRVWRAVRWRDAHLTSM